MILRFFSILNFFIYFSLVQDSIGYCQQSTSSKSNISICCFTHWKRSSIWTHFGKGKFVNVLVVAFHCLWLLVCVIAFLYLFFFFFPDFMQFYATLHCLMLSFFVLFWINPKWSTFKELGMPRYDLWNLNCAQTAEKFVKITREIIS